MLREVVTARHIALAAAAILVIGLGVKLFYEVRASPTIEPAAPIVEPAAGRGERPALDTPTDQARDRLMGTVKDRGTVSPPRSGGLAQRLDEETDPATPTRLDAAMTDANKAYDRQDYDEAKELATRLLATDPGNVRMRRILVSTACMQGDPTEAQKHYDLLPTDGDARQVMRIRCKRENIALQDTLTPPK